MPLPKRSNRLFRLLAALVAACYCFVGMTLSFQHADCGLHETSAYLRLPGLRSANIQFPRNTQITAKHGVSHPTHVCIACEWQSHNVSPALPVFTLYRVPPSIATRVITTFPRYLKRPLARTSSRAPPIA